MDTPRLETTQIPGLLVVRTPLRPDARGWFKEAWQREKMVALGLPDFGPVQNNVSFNTSRGSTRGIHAEPWDKFVSVATGLAFGAWVDLREGDTFGTTFHLEIDPSVAVFVPRGVGNAYQTLEDGTAYTYLVNEHWRPATAYPALNLADPTSAIPWPVPLADAEVSDKDRANPSLDAVSPMPPRKTLVIGGLGQLGRALAAEFPDAECVDRPELDITDAAAVAAWPWEEYDVVLNAAAYTDVDAAETPEGRRAAWSVNAVAVGNLAAAARAHGLTLIHYSTDYVFDGGRSGHPEDEPLSPLGVYGQAKAAGELAARSAPRHYVVRTSWLVGDGGNFVRTMADLAAQGVSPTVVDDQVGRLTFGDEVARATRHLLGTPAAAHGVYNVTNGGDPTSWFELAQLVFAACGRDADDVRPVSSAKYSAGKPVAPRPANSVLSLSKLEATGFVPADAREALAHYLRRVSAETAGRTSTR
jgi:dTDP-4-dehydrorhamnose 3,5-epimerase/reductase